MMRTHELRTALKTLHLGGMLQTLDLRRQQVESDRLGHVEFPALLVEDEIKCRQAQALGHAASRAGFSVLFTKPSSFLGDPAGGRADGSWEPRLRRDVQPDVLILDDFGMREVSPNQAEECDELIGERVRTRSQIVTSNRAPADRYPLFPNAVLAASAPHRLVHSPHHVVLHGRTYRPLRRPGGGGAVGGPPAASTGLSPRRARATP